jgi:uncharacterized protein YutE (UPF0331/DUF86 family)
MVSPNQTLVLEKLDTIVRCIERIRDKTPGSLADLNANIDNQDIIVLNLERAIQACVDIASHIVAYTNLPIPNTMAESFERLASANIISSSTALRMKKAVGLRDILVHEYQKVDWTILWEVVTNHSSDFHSFVSEIRAASARGF